MKIETSAFAKINLGLHVRSVLSTGYHELESLVTFANIKDKIEVNPSKDLTLSITGPFAHAVPKDSTNIVIKAAKFLSPEGKAHIKLTKNLPVEAGLGGGSADAAATLRSLSHFWKIPIPNYTETLGADVPVCLQSQTAIMKGIGEKITPVVIPENLKIILIKPKIGLSTKEIFNKLESRNNPEMPIFLGTKSPDIFFNHLRSLRNDLLNASIYQAPIIKNIINFLKTQSGIKYTQMSGSGTTCFGLFDNSENAKIAFENITNNFPDMWCENTQLINSGNNFQSKLF